MTIPDSIQTNKGLCLGSSMIILLHLKSVYLLCHQHTHGRHFGITFSGLMPCQQYLYYGIVLPMCSARAREMCLA